MFLFWVVAEALADGLGDGAQGGEQGLRQNRIPVIRWPAPRCGVMVEASDLAATIIEGRVLLPGGHGASTKMAPHPQKSRS